MNHCSCDATSIEHKLAKQSQARFVDWHNLPKPRWRDALKALASPAARVHRYRNLRSAIFYDAVDDVDCGDRA